MATLEQLQTDTSVQRHYSLLIRRGFNHDDALRLATGYTGPSVQGTDTVLMGGDDGFGNDHIGRKMALAKAKAAGVSVSGMKFHPGLCRHGVPFDPQAWYRDTADVKAKATRLGRCVEGSITVNTPVFEADLAANEKPYRVARHVVADDVNREITQCHGGRVSKEKENELYSKHQDRHSGNQSKGKVLV